MNDARTLQLHMLDVRELTVEAQTSVCLLFPVQSRKSIAHRRTHGNRLLASGH
jgi:hypothetical protein